MFQRAFDRQKRPARHQYRRSKGADGAALVNRLRVSDLQEWNPQLIASSGMKRALVPLQGQNETGVFA